MSVVAEIAGLAQGAVRSWLRHFPVIGAWFCAGWTAREIGIQAAVLLGTNLVAAMVCFVVGMVIWVICLVMMLHVLTRDLVSFRVVSDDPSVPAIRPLSRREVLLEAVLPFLAVFAVWGLTEEQIVRAFNANMAYHGLDGAAFSISYAAWQLYLVIAVGAWLAQWVLSLVLRGRGGLPAALTMTLLRGMAILTAFIGLGELLARSTNWLGNRQIAAWTRQGWRRFLDALPEWGLPFDLTLPEAVAAGAATLWNHLVPGIFDAVLLPLIWLALTAMVVGWHDFTHGVANGRLASLVTSQAERVRATRLGQGVAAARAASPIGVLKYWAWEQLEDFLPAIQALRLIIRSGWVFLGAYLVVGAAARAVDAWLTAGMLWLIGPNSFADTLRYLSLLDLVAGLIGWTLAMCVYAAAFDRAMIGAVAHAQRLQTTDEPQTRPAVHRSSPAPMAPAPAPPGAPPPAP